MFKITNNSSRNLGFPKLGTIPPGGFAIVDDAQGKTYQKIPVVAAWVESGDCEFEKGKNFDSPAATAKEPEAEVPDDEQLDLEFEDGE